MPGLNGLELLNMVKTINPNVRTILMNAFDIDLNELYQNYMRKGIIDSSIEKPVSVNALCQRVRDELMAYQLAFQVK